MKRVCGFALFFFSLGIVFGWLLSNQLGQFCCVVICLGISYCLFFR